MPCKEARPRDAARAWSGGGWSRGSPHGSRSRRAHRASGYVLPPCAGPYGRGGALHPALPRWPIAGGWAWATRSTAGSRPHCRPRHAGSTSRAPCGARSACGGAAPPLRLCRHSASATAAVACRSAASTWLPSAPVASTGWVQRPHARVQPVGCGARGRGGGAASRSREGITAGCCATRGGKWAVDGYGLLQRPGQVAGVRAA
mmetsp:Transcript_4069/g.12563  ORF Transcript_4069/g.12563 Transcript_4069/m.12563 type:complete len:203 (+) Transcript_4069:910-1518(+)